MKVSLQTAPTLSLLSLNDLKLHLRIDTDEVEDYSEDALLTDIVGAATGHIEDITSRQLLTATWDYYLDEFPSGSFFLLPFGRLQTVTHIKYTDSDGTITTMAAGTDYIVETNGDACGRIVLPYADTWPSFTEYTSKPIVVRFTCGWTTAAAVPASIRVAAKLIAADMYSNREGQVMALGGSEYRENKTVQRLLASYRLWDTFL